MWWVSVDSKHLRNKIDGVAYSARGNWGQYIIVIPAHKLVIAHASDKKAGDPKIKSKQMGKLLQLILAAKKDYPYKQN
jgi:CubicO group peptidase (beta-lactamase class C family)